MCAVWNLEIITTYINEGKSTVETWEMVLVIFGHADCGQNLRTSSLDFCPTDACEMTSVTSVKRVSNSWTASDNHVDGQDKILKCFGHDSSPRRRRGTRIGGNSSYKPPGAP